MKFYVYEHWRPDLDVCFYVGKGSGRRASDMRKRNRHHCSISKKLAGMGMCVEVRMVACGLSEQQAFALELERISFWKSSNIKLANKSDGGGGSSGYRHTDEAKSKIKAKSLAITEETREKLRAAIYRREWGPMSSEQKAKIAKTKSGTKITLQHKAAISLGLKGKTKGIPRTEEQKAKISLALKGKPWTESRRNAQRRRKEGITSWEL